MPALYNFYLLHFYPDTDVLINLEEKVQETGEGFDLQVCVNITEDFEIHIVFMLTSESMTATCKCTKDIIEIDMIQHYSSL